MESSQQLVDHLPLVVVDDDDDVVDVVLVVVVDVILVVVVVVVVDDNDNDIDDEDEDVAVVLYVYINKSIRKKDLLWRLYKETTPITSNHSGHLLFFLSYYIGREQGISAQEFFGPEFRPDVK
jgi:hypothetical protein